MKRITLMLGMAIAGQLAFSQNAPCPDIQSNGFTAISVNGSLCTSTVYAYVVGNPHTKKGFKISVYQGGVGPANLLVDTCHLIPKDSPATIYESPSFTAPCTANIVYVLEAYTASNGECQGNNCSQTFTVEAGPLPIRLSSFYGKRVNSNVALSWSTESEINAKEFIIQRRIGTEFVDIATVAASNKITGSSYTYTDNNNSRTTSQYRLKMVDLDGKSALSEIRTVKGTSAVSDFIVFPNPSAGNAKVTITDIADPTDVQVIDNAGRIIQTISMNNSNTVDLNNLQKGLYMIRIVNKTSGESLTKKLTVVN